MTTSSRQEHAFSAYVALGPDRNLRWLHKAIASAPGALRRVPSLRTLETWSSRYAWQHRIAEIDVAERAETGRRHLEWVTQHRERLRQEGLLLQQKGVEWLNAKEEKDVSAHEAIRAIDAGFKLEALSLGEATERLAIEDDDPRLKGLSDDELERLVRQIRAHDPGGGEGAGEAASG